MEKSGFKAVCFGVVMVCFFCGNPLAHAGTYDVLYLYGSIPPALEDLRLNDTSNQGFSKFRIALEAEGFNLTQQEVGPGSTFTLTPAILSNYKVLILSSNNRLFSAAERQTVSDWVNAGGGLVAWSDAAFGRDTNGDGVIDVTVENSTIGLESNNTLTQQFGLFFIRDTSGTFWYSNANQYEFPHFIWQNGVADGVISFRGEGVSPMIVSPPAQFLARWNKAQGSRAPWVRSVDQTQFGATMNNTAGLAIAHVGSGRVVGTFDRNTFWNKGAGTNIDQYDNKQFAKNLVLWAAGLDGDPCDDNSMCARYVFEGDAQDVSGNGRHGTLMNEATFGPGIEGGYSLWLDGADDYVEVTDYRGITGKSARTVSAWIQSPGTGANMALASWGPNISGQQYLFGVFSNGSVGVYCGGPFIRTTQNLLDNQWHHVAAVLPAEASPMLSDIQLYVNGVLQTDTYLSGDVAVDTVAAGDLLIGAFESSPGQTAGYFAGRIDDLRLYNYAIDAAGIASLMDVLPPTPDPLSFETAPAAISSQEVTMIASQATDENGPVEYYFAELSGNPGGADSGWQTSQTYTNTGLSGGVEYIYTVKARDAAHNETAASAPAYVFTPVSQIVELPFIPTDDAYIQGTTPYNTTQLRVEPNNRVSYLKFDVTGIPANYQVTGVTLQLTENGDTGSGTLRFYKGSHNNWTETTLTAATAPAAGTQVGSRTGAVSTGQTISVEVTPLVSDNGVVSIVVMMDSGGNDIWFGSKESGAKSPVLTVTAESTLPAEEDPPTPDPAQIESVVSTVDSITLTAVQGTDASEPIYYYFAELSGNPGAADSDWQLSRIYTIEGLAPATEYIYTVKMRDAFGNATAASAPVSVFTLGVPDITQDGEVNLDDLAELSRQWARTDCFDDELCQGADINADGRVDLEDILIIAENWLSSEEEDILLLLLVDNFESYDAAGCLPLEKPSGI